ncbi:MAG: ankyrin repeat domain-containing protein [Pyrinomonadaceae bacterium]
MKRYIIYAVVTLATFIVGTFLYFAMPPRRSRLETFRREPPVAFQPVDKQHTHPCKAGYYDVWIPDADGAYGEVYDPPCYSLQAELSTAAREGDVEKVKMLLNEGANPNGHLDDSPISLREAVWNGHTEAARVLLDNGADINAGDGLHWWALHGAVYHNDAEMVRLLLSRGANFSVKCDFSGHGYSGITPLQFAEEKGYGNVVELLDAAGASSWQHRLNRRIAKLIGKR